MLECGNSDFQVEYSACVDGEMTISFIQANSSCLDEMNLAQHNYTHSCGMRLFEFSLFRGLHVFIFLPGCGVQNPQQVLFSDCTVVNYYPNTSACSDISALPPPARSACDPYEGVLNYLSNLLPLAYNLTAGCAAHDCLINTRPENIKPADYDKYVYRVCWNVTNCSGSASRSLPIVSCN